MTESRILMFRALWLLEGLVKAKTAIPTKLVSEYEALYLDLQEWLAPDEPEYEDEEEAAIGQSS